MTNTLGLDLGTASIGWIIRDNESENDSEIIDAGVVKFDAGIGEKEGKEFSRAADRRSHRSKRRLYNAKRYRKWQILKVLIKNGMCPLDKTELKLWSSGEWVLENGKMKNKGRKYPMNPEFIAWLRMDRKYFGDKGECKNRNGIGSYFRKSPYDLRCELIDNFEENEQKRKYKIGRALYHLVQRRGFKSSGDKPSEYGGITKIEDFDKTYPDRTNWTIAQKLVYLQSGNDADTNLRLKRIRNIGVPIRDTYENELKAICDTQRINPDITAELHKAIYKIRQAKGNKGLIGKCTLENDQFEVQYDEKEGKEIRKYTKKGKPRIPESHPLFEEFRALQFINNIKWRLKGTKKWIEGKEREKEIFEKRKEIFEKLFFRKSKDSFKFSEISERFSERGKYEFNFDKHNPTVSAMPVTTALMNVFDVNEKQRVKYDGNTFGVNWEALKIEYTTSNIQGQVKNVALDYIGLWHLLFDYLLTQRDKKGQDEIRKFALNKFGWDEDKAKEFSEISINQGYASLSYYSINKIVKYLREGKIYNEAVVFANLENVLNKDIFKNQKEEILNAISKIIIENEKEKKKLNIVNSIIQEDKAIDRRVQDKDYHLTKWDINIEDKLISIYGMNDWQDLDNDKKNGIRNFITEKYLRYLQGKQTNEEKAAFKPLAGKPDYYKLPRQDEAIKKLLKEKFKTSEESLQNLWHHSDIDIYPKVESRTRISDEIYAYQLGDPMPPSKAWKNPMALRTMHELKKLINYLLKVGKIDENTRIVVELARELNTSNYRKAYTAWIKDRETENELFKTELIALNIGRELNDDDYKKFRSAIGQIEKDKVFFNENKGLDFKKKYDNFIEVFLKRKNKKQIDEDTSDETIAEVNDYLMYLILNKEEFVRLLNFKPDGSNEWITQIINTSVKFRDKRKELKELLTKYRLWKEQKFQCLYTGQMIPFTSLIDPTKVQIEHTVPRSISFDSELKNLTVADARYNAWKGSRFPMDCNNYQPDGNGNKFINLGGANIDCGYIIDRVNALIKPKVEELKKRIKNLEFKAKKIPDWQIDKKNGNIQLRYYLQFELDYWDWKLKTFTTKKENWKDSFKNSQLTDTQSITKYSKAYLKSLFRKVDVQRGETTSIFRKIYDIEPRTEKKDRTTHVHHAIDAAVLTLIPESAKRDEMMRKYFEYDDALKKTKGNREDNSLKDLYQEIIRRYEEEKASRKFIPYESFHRSHITNDIAENILINHVKKDQKTVATKKYQRKRGKIMQFENADGTLAPRIQKGDAIRGQLNEETFMGAIKVAERNEKNAVLKDINGKYILRQKNGDDEILIVVRKSIDKIDIDKDEIIDIPLKNHIKRQLDAGLKITDVVDFNDRLIRHIRCRVKAGRGNLTKDKVIDLKKHSFVSEHSHKQFVLSKIKDNSLYLLYEFENIREAKIVSLFDFSDNFSEEKEVWKDEGWNKLINGTSVLALKRILKVGQKTIFFTKSRDELKNKDIELNKRVFIIYKFNDMGSPYIYLQNHIEARADKDLGDGDTVFDNSKYQYRLKLKASKLNCVIEGIDFEVKPDGQITFKF